MAMRRRIGVLFPTHNQTVEPDFNSVMPAVGVSVHASRMWLPIDTEKDPGGGWTIKGIKRSNADLERAVRYVARADVELIVFACTGGSFSEGPQQAQEVIDRIEKEAGVPAIATASALVEAAQASFMRRVSVMSSYSKSTNELLKAHLEYHGFEVLGIGGPPHLQNPDRDPNVMGMMDPEDIVEFVCSTVKPEADGVVLSCTAWRTMEVAEELEQRLGVPVVTSNLANIWLALRWLGISTPVKGFGQLLSGVREAVAAR